VKNYFLWRNRVPITGAVLLLISAHFLWSGVLPDQRAAKRGWCKRRRENPLYLAAGERL